MILMKGVNWGLEMFNYRLNVSVLLLSIFFVLPTVAKESADSSSQLVTIGTAEVDKSFYSIGNDLCQAINANHQEHELLCLVQRSNDIKSNIKSVTTGKFEFALTRASWLYRANKGQRNFRFAGTKGKVNSALFFYNTADMKENGEYSKSAPKYTLSVAADVDPDVVYDIVKSAFENSNQFAGLTVIKPGNKRLTSRHLKAMHRGAVRYYREKGLM